MQNEQAERLVQLLFQAAPPFRRNYIKPPPETIEGFPRIPHHHVFCLLILKKSGRESMARLRKNWASPTSSARASWANWKKTARRARRGRKEQAARVRYADGEGNAAADRILPPSLRTYPRTARRALRRGRRRTHRTPCGDHPDLGQARLSFPPQRRPCPHGRSLL